MYTFDIIIITYNRTNELKSLLENIEKLNDKETYLNKVIIIDNNSPSDNQSMIELLKSEISYKIDYFRSEINLGVAKGRNLGIEKSNAELLFFIDDDAEIEHPDSLRSAYEFIVKQPEDIAVFALKILYYDNNQFQINAFPHKMFLKYHQKSSFLTSYFIGAGHIIKKIDLSPSIRYPEDIFYGMEEYDLSFKMISTGRKIMYTDCITILHKESIYGRQNNLEKSKSLWLNKSIITFKYLPKVYFITTCFLWSLKFLKDTKLNLKEFFKIYLTIYQRVMKTRKVTLNHKSLMYLKEVEARLWY